MPIGNLIKNHVRRQGVMLPVVFFLFFLNSSCNHLFYHPSDKIFRPTPQELSLAKRDISFSAQDQTLLHGWFFPSKQAKGTVVQFHGNADNMSGHYLSLVWLFRQGYNLFTFDYRGYGSSFNTPITPKGVAQDGLAALQKALQLHQQSTSKGKFIVIGQSLGGAIALKALEDLAEPEKIDLLVLDSAFSSYKKIAFKKLTSHWQTWPISPLAFLLISDQTSAKKIFNQWSIPLLLIHAKNDPVVPFSCTQDIYQRVETQYKWLWEIPDHGHMTTFHSPFWQKKFMTFIEKNI